MPVTTKRSRTSSADRTVRAGGRARSKTLRTPVIGMEAEFTVYVQDEKRRPEQVFRSPKRLVRQGMIPRAGRSFHLPSGGALYFDTGVVEVATPIIEIEHGCCIRVVRSLWEQIEFVRKELDAWEAAHDCTIRLEGFSTHYNVSVGDERNLDMQALARMLTYLLHAPVMLLATNRLSTGVGVRPRDHRLEVTVDFTPDPWLMVATATFVVGTILSVLDWPEFTVAELERRKFPVIHGFCPCSHTSRNGYLARFDCFPRNPFAGEPNQADWLLTDGRRLSLRQIAAEVAGPFEDAMRRLGDDRVVRHILSVLNGKARSLLDFTERPRRYEDAGRIVDWQRRQVRDLPRSRYERVIQRVITHRPIQVGTKCYRPERMRGWYEIIFREMTSGRRRVFNLDDLVRHCAV